MHYPWHVDLGSASIPLHPLIETLAIFIGFRYFLYLRKSGSDHIIQSNRLYIIAGAIFGSVAGSRIVGGLENISALLQSQNILQHFFINKTILGGLLGGVVGVELIKKIIREKHASGDLFTFPLILAMVIGRMGCFGMGIYEETYGTPTTLWTGIDLGDGIARHPVTLYEIGFLSCLWLFLLSIRRNYVLAQGSLFKLFMISYLIFRFLLDFIKPHYTWNIGLSTIQIFSLLGLFYYRSFIIKPAKLLAQYA